LSFTDVSLLCFVCSGPLRAGCILLLLLLFPLPFVNVLEFSSSLFDSSGLLRVGCLLLFLLSFPLLFGDEMESSFYATGI
jgi:hypothetical protein